MRVSILIPCFNNERWVRQTIESALAQTWPDKEVIVVDDGSTDGSLAVIRSFGERIRWVSGPNRGGNAARNHLLSVADGEWLQYVDADDYLLPGKIASQAACLAEAPDVDVIFSPPLVEEWSDASVPFALRTVPLAPPQDPWLLLARWELPQTGASLWKKAAIQQVGGWDESLSCCQEHDLYLRLLQSGARFHHCPAVGAVYRLWGATSVSRRDPQRVMHARLSILEREWTTLRQRAQLTPARRHAISLTRFEIARSLWLHDANAARQVIRDISRTDPTFTPEGVAAPASYRWIYELLGFAAAERIAAWRRGLRGPMPRPTAQTSR